MEKIKNILKLLGQPVNLLGAEPFRAEEDGRAYAVWKLETDRGPMVLKKTTPQERAVYGCPVRKSGPVVGRHGPR